MKYSSISLNFVILLAFCMLFSSCFEIIEEVNFYKDGTGTVRYSINMSESKQELKRLMKMKNVDGMPVPSKQDIDEEIETLQKALVNAKGISEVKVAKDYEEFIFSVSGRFEDLKALNRAIDLAAATMSPSQIQVASVKNFEYKNGKFIRHNNYEVNSDAYDQLPSIPKTIVDLARFVGIYRFSDSIKEGSNPHTKISSSRKALKVEATLGELIRGDKTVKNEIELE